MKNFFRKIFNLNKSVKWIPHILVSYDQKESILHTKSDCKYIRTGDMVYWSCFIAAKATNIPPGEYYIKGLPSNHKINHEYNIPDNMPYNSLLTQLQSKYDVDRIYIKTAYNGTDNFINLQGFYFIK